MQKFFISLSTVIGLTLSVSTFAENKKFTYDNIFVESLVLNQVTDFEPFAKGWLLYSDYDTYSRYKNDEFEFQDKVKAAGEKLQQLVQLRKEDKTPAVFNIDVRTAFDNYDFEKGKFEYQPLVNGHLYVSRDGIASEIPRQIDLYISNPEVINGIPMEKDKAKAFLQKRKSDSGNINRSVLLTVTVQFETADGLDNLTGKVLKYVVKDKDADSKVIYQQETK